jgi:hypothetical protein
MAGDMLKFMQELTAPVCVVGEDESPVLRCASAGGCVGGQCKWFSGPMICRLLHVQAVFPDIRPTEEAPLPVELRCVQHDDGPFYVKTLVYVSSASELHQLSGWCGRDCCLHTVRFHAFAGLHAMAAFDVVQAVGLAPRKSTPVPSLKFVQDWPDCTELPKNFGARADAAISLREGLPFFVLGVLEAHSRGAEREATLLRHKLNRMLVNATPGVGAIPVNAARRVLQSFCQQPADTEDARRNIGQALEVLGLLLARQGCWMQALVYLGVVHELASSLCKAGQAPPPLMSMLRLIRLEVMRESLLGAAVEHTRLRTLFLDTALGNLGITASVARQLQFEFADAQGLYRLPPDLAHVQPAAAQEGDRTATAAARMHDARRDLAKALAPFKGKVSPVHRSQDAAVDLDAPSPARGAELECYLFELGCRLATTEKPAGCTLHASLSACMLQCLRALRKELLPVADASEETSCTAPATAFEAQLKPFLVKAFLSGDGCGEPAMDVLALCEGELGAAVQALYKGSCGDPVLIRIETMRQAAALHAHIMLGAVLRCEQPDAAYRHVIKAYKYYNRLSSDEANQLICVDACCLSMLFVLGQMVLAPHPQSSEQLRERMALKFIAAFFVDVCHDCTVFELVIQTLRGSLSYYSGIGSYAHVARTMQQIRDLVPMHYASSVDVHVVRLEHAHGVLEWHVCGNAPLILVCRSMLESLRPPGPYVPFTGAWATFEYGDCLFVSPDGKVVDAVCTAACRATRAEGEHATARVQVRRVSSGRNWIIYEKPAAACKYEFRHTLQLTVQVKVRVGVRLLHFDVVAAAPFLRALQRQVVLQLGDSRSDTARAGWPHVFFLRGHTKILDGMTPLECLGCPLVLAESERLDVVAVHREDPWQCRFRSLISDAQAPALLLSDHALYQWLRHNMPAQPEHELLFFRLAEAAANGHLPWSMLALRGVQRFLARLTRVDQEAGAFAETMARVLSTEPHAGFYGLRACMQRFVGLAAHGLPDDASRWLAHVQALWGARVVARMRARGPPRLGSFDALFMQLFFVLHLLPAAEFLFVPVGGGNMHSDEHLMRGRRAVDHLETCKHMLLETWCSPAQCAAWFLCMAKGLQWLGGNKKRLVSCVHSGAAALRECSAQAGAHGVLLDKRVLAGWEGSRLHTLTLQEADEMLLAMPSSVRRGATAEPTAAPDADLPAPRPSLAPAQAAAPVATAAYTPATAPALAQVRAVEATFNVPDTSMAPRHAPDDDVESQCICIICMENEVGARTPCAALRTQWEALTQSLCRQRTHVLLPCRHFSFCHICVKGLSDCPLCKSEIKDTMHIYM